MSAELPYNTDITIYHRTGDQWETHHIEQALWLDNITTAAHDKEGIIYKHVVKLFLRPNSLSFTPACGVDFVLKDKGPEIDNTTPATISSSLKAIKNKKNILEFSYFSFGNLPHIEAILN